MFHSLSSGLHETFLIRNVTKWIDVSFSDLNVSLGSLTLSLTFSVWRSVGSGLVDFSVRRDVAVGDAGSVVRDHQWPAVGLLVVEVYIVQPDVACMADVEAFGRNGAEHPWFGIYFLLFGRRTLSVGFGVAALVINMDVAQADIFNDGSGYAADDGRVARVGIVDIDVADASSWCLQGCLRGCACVPQDGGRWGR